MRSVILTTLIFLLGASLISAQQRKEGLDFNKYKEVREQFFIKEVGLTETEAKIFIPLSNDLLKKKFNLNRQVKQELNKILSKEKLTESDYTAIVDKNVEIKLKEAELEKEYFQKFKKILPPEKLYRYQEAELKLMKLTLKKVSTK